MSETRNIQHFNFIGSGTQTISVGSDEHIAIFQADISVTSDATIEINIGSATIYKTQLIANSIPIQLFFYDFGKGRGTGVKGDDLSVTVSESADIFIAYIIYDN